MHMYTLVTIQNELLWINVFYIALDPSPCFIRIACFGVQSYLSHLSLMSYNLRVNEEVIN